MHDLGSGGTREGIVFFIKLFVVKNVTVTFQYNIDDEILVVDICGFHSNFFMVKNVSVTNNVVNFHYNIDDETSVVEVCVYHLFSKTSVLQAISQVSQQ